MGFSISKQITAVLRNNSNIEYKKEPNVIRILSLGDSHTQGYEVNQKQTFSYVAEQLLNKKGFNSTVINAGVSGFGTAEELIFLENEGYKYSPDVVVIGFYANDFEDNIKSGFFSLENDSLVIKNMNTCLVLKFKIICINTVYSNS